MFAVRYLQVRGTCTNFITDIWLHAYQTLPQDFAEACFVTITNMQPASLQLLELLAAALFFVAVVALIVFLVRRNLSDKRALEEQLNRTYRGAEKGPDDVETDEVMK